MPICADRHRMNITMMRPRYCRNAAPPFALFNALILRQRERQAAGRRAVTDRSGLFRQYHFAPAAPPPMDARPLQTASARLPDGGADVGQGISVNYREPATRPGRSRKGAKEAGIHIATRKAKAEWASGPGDALMADAHTGMPPFMMAYMKRGHLAFISSAAR